MKNNLVKFIVLILILLVVPDIIMLLPIPNTISGSHILYVCIYYFLKIVFVEGTIIWMFKELVFKDE